MYSFQIIVYPAILALASRVSADGPKVRAVTAILKLRLRGTLEFGTFSPPLQLLNLMAKASMDRYHYLPKKDPDGRRHTRWEGFNLA